MRALRHRLYPLLPLLDAHSPPNTATTTTATTTTQAGGVAAVARAYPKLDFAKSPLPTVVAEPGGRATHNLMSFHFLPSNLYALRMNPEASFWARAVKDGKLLSASNEPTNVTLDAPAVYGMPSYAPYREARVADAYVPFDVRGCLVGQPLTTSVCYCSYSFKDSQLNTGARNVLLFNSIGVERVINSAADPAVIGHDVTYRPCPANGPIVLDLDGVSDSVLVKGPRGVLRFHGVTFRGGRTQHSRAWPQSAMLLPTFAPVAGGKVEVVNSTIEVDDVGAEAAALRALPKGHRPQFAGAPPTPGASAPFRVRFWRVDQNWWLESLGANETFCRTPRCLEASTWFLTTDPTTVALSGGRQAPTGPSSSWGFANVLVRQLPANTECYHGPVTTLVSGGMVVVLSSFGCCCCCWTLFWTLPLLNRPHTQHQQSPTA